MKVASVGATSELKREQQPIDYYNMLEAQVTSSRIPSDATTTNEYAVHLLKQLNFGS